MAFPDMLLEDQITHLSKRIYCEVFKKINGEISLDQIRTMVEDSSYQNIEKIVREELTKEKYGSGAKF